MATMISQRMYFLPVSDGRTLGISYPSVEPEPSKPTYWWLTQLEEDILKNNGNDANGDLHKVIENQNCPDIAMHTAIERSSVAIVTYLYKRYKFYKDELQEHLVLLDEAEFEDSTARAAIRNAIHNEIAGGNFRREGNDKLKNI